MHDAAKIFVAYLTAVAALTFSSCIKSGVFGACMAVMVSALVYIIFKVLFYLGDD